MSPKNNDFTEKEPVAVETPQHELMTIMAEGDPDGFVKTLERKAELAKRWQDAIHRVLLSCTWPGDWTEFPGQKEPILCLGSAGAERIGHHFPIKTYDVKWRKETGSDGLGSYYRYIYEGYGSLGERTVFVHGIYSSREELLGKAHGEYKAIEEIKETFIQNAAYHIFCGNIIKALLGLRALPKSKWEAIFKMMGEKPEAGGKASFKTGSKGGAAPKNADAQTELFNILNQLAEQNMLICIDEGTAQFSCRYDADKTKQEIMDISGHNCAGFKNTEDKWIYPNYHFSKLSGKWLFAALGNVKKIKERFEKGEFADYGDNQ